MLECFIDFGKCNTIPLHKTYRWLHRLFFWVQYHDLRRELWSKSVTLFCENLWVGPLNVAIQSEAVCGVSESKSETSITDWIGVFKPKSIKNSQTRNTTRWHPMTVTTCFLVTRAVRNQVLKWLQNMSFLSLYFFEGVECLCWLLAPCQ